MTGALLSIRQFPVISCVFHAIVLCRKNTEIISLRELLAAYRWLLLRLLATDSLLLK